jgi:hypothetical protein
MTKAKLFSDHEPDPLIRELDGDILWEYRPMDPNDTRGPYLSTAPFEAAAKLRAMKWQPIETAPKDETSVLLYGFWEGELNARDDQPEVWKAHFAYDKWWVEGGEYYSQCVINPTHWMPLPEPPR